MDEGLHTLGIQPEEELSFAPTMAGCVRFGASRAYPAAGGKACFLGALVDGRVHGRPAY